MSVPTVVATSPASGALDVVLGTTIIVTFSEFLDTSTVDASSFVVSTPGTHTEYTPESLLTRSQETIYGREYVTGAFTFAVDIFGRTVVTFTPDHALQPNHEYTVLLAGATSITGNVIQNASGQALASNYVFTFSTGELNLTQAPARSIPIQEIAQLLPADIEVSPSFQVENDLTSEIVLVFPADIDPTSIDLADIKVAVQAVLNDPDVAVPPDLVYDAVLDGNKIHITISGWPATVSECS